MSEVKKNIAVIEDEDDIRDLIKMYLNFLEDYRCILAVNSIESFLLEDFTGNPPETIICDIGLPGISGVEGIACLKEKCPTADILMLTSYDDPDLIFKSLCAGASGYLLKSSTAIEKIKESLDIIASGGSPMSPQVARQVIQYFNPPKETIVNPLSPREKEIVEGLVDGLSYKMIAGRMEISIDTVRQHIKNIYRKLNVNSKTEVITKALRKEI